MGLLDVQDRVEKQESAYGEETTPNNRHDPMDITSRVPSEPRQANRNTKSPDKSQLESNLGFNSAILTELRLLGPVQVEEEGRDDDQGTDEDAWEGAAFLAGGENCRCL